MNARDRRYFESLIESNVLLNRDIDSLDDGGAFSPDYIHKVNGESEIDSPLRWGRVIENVEQEIIYEEVSSVCVVANIRRTIRGELHIELPRDAGGRMKQTHISKPFVEHSTRKAHFTLVAQTDRPEENWRLSAISLVKGGTGNDGVAIGEMSLKFSSGDRLSLTAQSDPVIPLDQEHELKESSVGSVDIDLNVKLNTAEIEPNMVVFRAGMHGRVGQRNRLAFKTDSRNGSQYIHTYGDVVRTQSHPGLNYAVVEAVTRETLFDVDAPVSTSYWGIPYDVH